jgi:uncharacterized protein YkwD
MQIEDFKFYFILRKNFLILNSNTMKHYSLFLCLISLAHYYSAIINNNLPPGCLDAFRSSALNAHNTLRGRHNSSGLTENVALDATALNTANNMATQGQLLSSSNLFNKGENLHVFYTNNPLTINFCSGKFF